MAYNFIDDDRKSLPVYGSWGPGDDEISSRFKIASRTNAGSSKLLFENESPILTSHTDDQRGHAFNASTSSLPVSDNRPTQTPGRSSFPEFDESMTAEQISENFRINRTSGKRGNEMRSIVEGVEEGASNNIHHTHKLSPPRREQPADFMDSKASIAPNRILRENPPSNSSTSNPNDLRSELEAILKDSNDGHTTFPGVNTYPPVIPTHSDQVRHDPPNTARSCCTIL